MAPETRYARTADSTTSLTGDGPIDLLVMRAWHSHLEHEWEEPVLAGIFRRLGSVGRVIRLDRRGTSLSDRFDPSSSRPWRREVDDIRAVLDAAGSERVVAIGAPQGGAVLLLRRGLPRAHRRPGAARAGALHVRIGRSGDIRRPKGSSCASGERLRRRQVVEFARRAELTMRTHRVDPGRGATRGHRGKELRTMGAGRPDQRFGDPAQHSRAHPGRVASRFPRTPPPLGALLPHAKLVEVPGHDHALLSENWQAAGRVRAIHRLTGGQSRSWIGSWRRSCSLTSSARPRRRRGWRPGGGLRADTKRSSGASSRGTGGN